MSRKQTPLETLARDHNWRMGSLRRSLAMMAQLHHPEAQRMGMKAVELEMEHQNKLYESRKKQVKRYGDWV